MDNVKTMNLYFVYDEVAEIFMPPFPASTDKEASRSFMDSLKKQNYEHFEDFSLYLLGSFSFVANKCKDGDIPFKRIGSCVYDNDSKNFYFCHENKGVEEK